jgi:hypothetical protein
MSRASIASPVPEPTVAPPPTRRRACPSSHDRGDPAQAQVLRCYRGRGQRLQRKDHTISADIDPQVVVGVRPDAATARGDLDRLRQRLHSNAGSQKSQNIPPAKAADSVRGLLRLSVAGIANVLLHARRLRAEHPEGLAEKRKVTDRRRSRPLSMTSHHGWSSPVSTPTGRCRVTPPDARVRVVLVSSRRRDNKPDLARRWHDLCVPKFGPADMGGPERRRRRSSSHRGRLRHAAVGTTRWTRCHLSVMPAVIGDCDAPDHGLDRG